MMSEEKKGFSEKNLFRAIQIIFVVFPFFYGMYYEFCGAVMTVLLSGILILLFRIKKRFQMSLSVGVLLSALFVCCYIVSVAYAVDRGMAVLGVMKVLWIPLFLLAYSQLQQEKREKLFSMLPYVGAALCLLGFVAYFLPWLKEYFYINGRLSSGFQYANTFALFLLTGVILLYGRKEIAWKDYVTGMILLPGIALSGSRIVFVLTVLVLLYLIITYRNKQLACAVFSLAVLFLIYIYFKGDITNIGRITTFSFTDSTLIGRFLYAEDAMGLLQKYPFGMGHLGYYYMQNEIQTGVYSVQYVHNDLLQIGLDIGWLPMILYFVSVIYCLVSKQLRHVEKIILSIIFIHGLLDFDLAYGAIQCIVFMIMGNQVIAWNGKGVTTVCMAGRQWRMVFSVFFALGLYLSVPLLARYQDDMEFAIKWYPWDTEAKLQILSETEDVERAEELADGILQQNDTCALAYYAKAMVADCQNDYGKMIRYQKKSIERNYFSHEAYSDYAYMLYDGLHYAMETEDNRVYGICQEEILKLSSYMEAAKGRLGKLGEMIHDQPDLELDEDMQKIMEAAMD